MKSTLFSFLFSILAICAQAQPTRQIPASVLPLLQKAEQFRSNYKLDSSIVLLEKAQEEYKRLNMEYESLCLYPKIFILVAELDIVDNDFLFLSEKIKKFEAKRLSLYPNDQWLYNRYLISNAFIQRALLNQKGYEMALKALSQVNFKSDWEAEFFYRLLLSFNKNYEYSLYDNNELANYQLLLTNAPIDSFKTAYLHYSYPAYLWYVVSNTAEYYTYARDYELALKATRTSFDYLEKATYLDSGFYANSFDMLASIYMVKSDYVKAIEFQLKSIQYIPNNGSSITENKTHYNQNLSKFYEAIDQHKNAIKYAKIALQKSYEFQGNTHEKTLAFTALIKNYNRQNRFSNAQAYVDSVLANEKEMLENTSPIIALCAIAEVGYFHQLQKNYDLAQKYYNRAEQIHKSNPDNSPIPTILLQYRADLASVNNNFATAINLYQQLLGRLVANHRLVDDLDIAPLDKIKHKFKYLKVLLQKTACIKKAYIDKQDFSALRAYQAHADLAIQILNNLRDGVERDNSKTTLLNLSFQAYEHSIRAKFLTDNLAKKAVDYEFIFKQMEDSKAFLLSNSLQEQQAKQFGGIPTDLLQLEKELSYNIQFYTQKQQETDEPKTQKLYQDYVFQFSQRLDSLKDRFKREFPKYHTLKYADNYVSLAKIQSFLQPEQAILSYFEGVEEIFLLYIKQKEVKFFPIPKPDNYSALIKSFREIITDSRGEFELKKLVDISSSFYQLFIPFELENEVKRLIIIADGSLHYTPFETFVDKNKLQNNANNSYNNLPYLIRDKSISYQYSAQLWYQLHQNSQPTKAAKMLAFAPDYKPLDEKSLKKIPEHLRGLRNSLSPLSGTISEVQSLEKLYAGKFFYNQQAVENQFKALASQYNVIHLAMHGLVDEESPEFSSLAFSAGFFDDKNTPDSSNFSDNFLQCYEIKALELNADLVVLSACETAFGKYERGEGAISIGRSFFYNGTKSLLMTQWSINDASTPILIGHFYNGLQQGKTKDEALQYAKIQYLSQVQGLAAHPAFWAAFVQMGNTQNLTLASPTGFYTYILYIGAGLVVATLIYLFLRRKKRLEK